MTAAAVIFVVLGVAVALAGLWWLWGGRWGWLPASRFHESVSLPTRMVVGLVHLVLGYHLVIWHTAPHRGLQVPRQHWAWVVLGGAVAVGGSLLLDRVERKQGGSG